MYKLIIVGRLVLVEAVSLHACGKLVPRYAHHNTFNGTIFSGAMGLDLLNWCFLSVMDESIIDFLKKHNSIAII